MFLSVLHPSIRVVRWRSSKRCAFAPSLPLAMQPDLDSSVYSIPSSIFPLPSVAEATPGKPKQRRDRRSNASADSVPDGFGTGGPLIPEPSLLSADFAASMTGSQGSVDHRPPYKRSGTSQSMPSLPSRYDAAFEGHFDTQRRYPDEDPGVTFARAHLQAQGLSASDVLSSREESNDARVPTAATRTATAASGGKKTKTAVQGAVAQTHEAGASVFRVGEVGERVERFPF